MNALYAEFLERAGALTKGDIAGADGLMGDIVMSPLPDATFKPLAEAIGKATGLDSRKLLKSLEDSRRALEKLDPDNTADLLRTKEELEAACAPLLDAPDVLLMLSHELPVHGIAGTGHTVLAAFVAAHSRRFRKPLHIIAAGPSGLGKSYEVEAALRLIMPCDRYEIADTSDKAFLYDGTPLSGKVVYLVEATMLQRDPNSPLSLAIRTMMSEGVARYKFTDFDRKTRDGMPTVHTIERGGPAAVMITTTAPALHTEIENRAARFPADGSDRQTERILDMMAEDREMEPPPALVETWRAFDELLVRFGASTAWSPFKRPLVQALKTKLGAAGRPLPTRLRRDSARC